MRTEKGLAALIVVLASAAVTILGASAASADHCLVETNIFDSSGEASADCHLVDAGRDGSGEYTLTPEEQWNAYCNYQIDTGNVVDYAPNAKVRYSDQGNLDAERVAQLNYDPTGTYASFIAFCDHPTVGGSGVGGEFIYNVVPPVPLDVLRAAAKARIDIDPPLIETNPSFTDRFTVVNIETWLWVDQAYWYEEKKEEETRGFVTVEVRAEPESMTWKFNDPDTSQDTCYDPGTPWTPTAGSTDCKVTFNQSSAGRTNNAYQGDATVSWVFSWSLNGTDQGPFDTPLLATTNFELQVGEIQGVES